MCKTLKDQLAKIIYAKRVTDKPAFSYQKGKTHTCETKQVRSVILEELETAMFKGNQLLTARQYWYNTYNFGVLSVLVTM